MEDLVPQVGVALWTCTDAPCAAGIDRLALGSLVNTPHGFANLREIDGNA